MIKYILLSFAFFVTARALFCTSNKNCKEDECCMTGPLEIVKFCAKRPGINDLCNPKISFIDKGEHVYIVGCPCQDGLKCEMGKSLFSKAPKCQNKAETF